MLNKMNVRGIYNFTNSRGKRGIIFANNAILGSSSIVGRPCDKYIAITADRRGIRNTVDTVAGKETRHTNPVWTEKIISRYVLQFTWRERDVPKDPWKSHYYSRSSLRSRPGARLGYFRDSAYGPK